MFSNEFDKTSSETSSTFLDNVRTLFGTLALLQVLSLDLLTRSVSNENIFVSKSFYLIVLTIETLQSIHNLLLFCILLLQNSSLFTEFDGFGKHRRILLFFLFFNSCFTAEQVDLAAWRQKALVLLPFQSLT